MDDYDYLGIGRASYRRLRESLRLHDVAEDFADTLINYLVLGLVPGSLVQSILANDWRSAILCCHPLNTVESLKNLTRWIEQYMPPEARDVSTWCDLSQDQRTRTLLQLDLIYTQDRELLETIRGDDATVS